jgi:phage repressor protein C with HTH and peptisase S24 domain
MRTVGERLRWAREQAGYETAADAARRLELHPQNVRDHEADRRGVSPEQAATYARSYGVDRAWLLFGGPTPKRREQPPLVRIIGTVGANPDGSIIHTTGQETGDAAPPPPSGGPESVALEVRGHSMRGLADDGALIYISDQRTPPTPDMLGHVVLVETEDGQVLVKRLLRGSEKGLFDLESLNGPTLHDQRLVWAAHVIAIVPPFEARRIIVRHGMVA